MFSEAIFENPVQIDLIEIFLLNYGDLYVCVCRCADHWFTNLLFEAHNYED